LHGHGVAKKQKKSCFYDRFPQHATPPTLQQIITVSSSFLITKTNS